MVDFTNLNDIYHLSMIIIGFCSLLVAAIALGRVIHQDRQRQLRAEAREKAAKKNKTAGKTARRK